MIEHKQLRMPVASAAQWAAAKLKGLFGWDVDAGDPVFIPGDGQDPVHLARRADGLTPATSLDGTELVVVVQGGVQKRVSVSLLEGSGGDFIPTSQKAAANGVATLGADGKVPWSQIPSNLRSYSPTTKSVAAYTLTSVLPAPIVIPAGFLRQGSQLNARFLIDDGDDTGAQNELQWFIDGDSRSGGTWTSQRITDTKMQAARREGSSGFLTGVYRYSNGYNFKGALSSVELDPDVPHTIDMKIIVAVNTTVTVREYEVTISDAPIPGVVLGTLDDSAAPEGCVGELLSSIIPIESHVSITSGTPVDVTSLPLGPGDWEVWGVVVMDPSGTSSPSAPYPYASISLTADTPDLVFCSGESPGVATRKTNPCNLNPTHRPVRVPSGSVTTVHLVVATSFGAGTCFAYGNLYARRVR